MNVLVLAGDRWHPADVVRAGLKPLESCCTFTWQEDASDWDAADLQRFETILLAKSNNVSETVHDPWMTEAVQNQLRDYVRQGGGLLAVHAGTAGYSETRILRALLGGVFDHHPEQCRVEFEPDALSPLTRDLQAFSHLDEHYFMTIDQPDLDIFLTSVSEHGAQSAGWRRSEGEGRIAVLTPGHNAKVWLDPNMRQLLERTLAWCGGKAKTL